MGSHGFGAFLFSAPSRQVGDDKKPLAEMAPFQRGQILKAFVLNWAPFAGRLFFTRYVNIAQTDRPVKHDSNSL